MTLPLIAAKVIANAQAYLDGRRSRVQAITDTAKLYEELFLIVDHSEPLFLPVFLANQAVRLLASTGDSREARWREVVYSLIEAVREEQRFLERRERRTRELVAAEHPDQGRC